MENSSESAAVHFSVVDCLAVLARYPAHATVHHDGVPAVLRGRYQREGAARRNSRKPRIFRTVTAANIHFSTF